MRWTFGMLRTIQSKCPMPRSRSPSLAVVSKSMIVRWFVRSTASRSISPHGWQGTLASIVLSPSSTASPNSVKTMVSQSLVTVAGRSSVTPARDGGGGNEWSFEWTVGRSFGLSACVTKTGGRHPLILDPVACPAGQDPGRPPNLRPCPDRCRSPYVLLPVRGKSLSGPRGADGQRRLACKLLLVHHEDGVESTVRVGLDRDVERVALPSP